MRLILAGLLLAFSLGAHAEDVFRIEYEKNGKSYNKYSNQEMRRRVWELERAVWQLQRRVFQLEGANHTGSHGDTWVCTLSPFTSKYSATGGSKAVAMHKVIEKCTKGENGGFHCKKPKCEK